MKVTSKEILKNIAAGLKIDLTRSISKDEWRAIAEKLAESTANWLEVIQPYLDEGGKAVELVFIKKETDKKRIANRTDQKDKVAFQKTIQDNEQFYTSMPDAVKDFRFKEPYANYSDDTVYDWAKEVWSKPRKVGRPRKTPRD